MECNNLDSYAYGVPLSEGKSCGANPDSKSLKKCRMPHLIKVKGTESSLSWGHLGSSRGVGWKEISTNRHGFSTFSCLVLGSEGHQGACENIHFVFNLLREPANSAS